MKYNELNISSHKNPKRVGRGISAGQGKTAGRGTKGQNARTGKKLRAGFEGGQNPLMMRLPKLPGFRSVKPTTQAVYTGQLESIKAKKITNFELADAGLISDPYLPAKLIIKGELTKPVTIEIQRVSATAKAMVEAAGGTVVIVPRLQMAAKKAPVDDSKKKSPSTK